MPPGTRFGRAFLLCCALLGAPHAAAREVPFLGGRVNDAAEMLAPETRMRLEEMLRAYEDSTSTQIVVLTVPSLEGDEIEEFAYRVATTWRLGQRGKDNGVLLLVARDERKVRIEVGTGLEGALTDATCGVIIRRVIVPAFKDADFDGGVTAGVEAIMQGASGTFTAEEAGEEADTTPWPVLLFGGGIFLLTVGLSTARALITTGFMSWFLYLFLIPFWYAFPMAFVGFRAGTAVFAAFLIGFPLLKIMLRTVPGAGEWRKQVAASRFFASVGGSGGSRSSGGGFSGGGGGFSGGGASGSW